MSETKVTFTGNADQLLAEHKKVVEAKDKDIAKIRQLLSESKKYHSEEGKQQREAATALEKTRTAQQVYNDQVQKWFHLLAQHKINKAQFNVLLGEEKKKLDATTEALKKASNAQVTLGKETGTASSGIMSMVTSFVSVTGAISAAVAALKAFSDEEKRMQGDSIGVILSIDQMARDYAIQGGLKTEAQVKASTDKILGAAVVNAVTPGVAFETASQLSTTGFADAEGETLDTALKIIKTSDVRKGSPKDYIEGAARWLTANNVEKTSANLEAVGIAMRSQFNNPVQASDLAEFAKAAPALNDRGVDPQTGLAMMLELRNLYDAPIVGTKMLNIAQRLGQMRGDTQAMEALGTLGLNPDEVDAIGESMPDALRKLNTALQAQPETERSGLRGKLFNNENESQANRLMQTLDNIDKNKNTFGDRTLYDAGVEIQMRGPAATDERRKTIKVVEEMRNREAVLAAEVMDRFEEQRYIERMKDSEGTTFGRAMRFNLMLERGLSNVRERVYGQDTNPQQALDASGYPEGQADGILGTANLGKDTGRIDSYRRFKAAADPQAAAMAENNAILKNIAGNQARVAEAVVNPANRPTVNPVITGRPK